MSKSKHLRSVHKFVESAGATACGIAAWPCRGFSSEADTATSNRIQISTQGQKVTCERCLKALCKQL